MPQNELHHSETAFEPKDLNARSVTITGGSVIVGVWITCFLLYFFFAYLTHRRAYTTPAPLPVARLQGPPPGPRIQASPRQDLRQYEAREDYLLTHYSWVDKTKGIVAIPIDKAIQLTAQRGIPPQKMPAGMELSKPAEGTRLTGLEGKVEPEAR